MPLQFPCTQCGKKLVVGDELAGQRVRCPTCQTILRAPIEEPVAVAPQPTVPVPVPIPAASAPIPVLASAPDGVPTSVHEASAPIPVLASAPAGVPTSVHEASAPAFHFDAWGNVHDGLGNWLLGNRIAIGAVSIQILATLVLGYLAATTAYPRDLDPFRLLITLGLLIPQLVGIIIMLAGVVRCCAVPAASGAKGYIIAVNVLWIAGLLLNLLDILNRVLPMRDMPGLMPMALHHFLRTWLILFWLSSLAAGAGCFLLFLRRISVHLGNAAVARRFSWFMLAWLAGPVLILLYPVLFALVVFAMGGSPGAVLLFVFIITYLAGSIVFMWLFFLWMWSLVGSVRDTIGGALEEHGQRRAGENPSGAEWPGAAHLAQVPRHARRNRILLAMVGLLVLMPGLAWPIAIYPSFLTNREAFQRKVEDLTRRKDEREAKARLLETGAAALGPNEQEAAFRLRDEASRIRRGGREGGDSIWGTAESGRFFRSYDDVLMALLFGTPLALLGLLLLGVIVFQARLRLGMLLGTLVGLGVGTLTCFLIHWVPYVEFEDSFGPPFKLRQTLLFAPATGLMLGLCAGLFFAWLHHQLCLPRATPTSHAHSPRKPVASSPIHTAPDQS